MGKPTAASFRKLLTNWASRCGSSAFLWGVGRTERRGERPNGQSLTLGPMRHAGITVSIVRKCIGRVRQPCRGNTVESPRHLAVRRHARRYVSAAEKAVGSLSEAAPSGRIATSTVQAAAEPCRRRSPNGSVAACADHQSAAAAGGNGRLFDHRSAPSRQAAASPPCDHRRPSLSPPQSAP